MSPVLILWWVPKPEQQMTANSSQWTFIPDRKPSKVEQPNREHLRAGTTGGVNSLSALAARELTECHQALGTTLHGLPSSGGGGEGRGGEDEPPPSPPAAPPKLCLFIFPEACSLPCFSFSPGNMISPCASFSAEGDVCKTAGEPEGLSAGSRPIC